MSAAPRGQVILATKLYLPRSRRALVPRPRLVSQLEQGLGRKLTVVSAPAGFGKTTLLAAWAEQSARPVAWLSLDAADNDPATFLLYLVSALRTVDGELGQEILDALDGALRDPLGALLPGLINELNRAALPLALVLDDYHLIDQETIHEALRFFIEHLPPTLHLLISGRADPPWPLARLRAGGEMNEVRGRDLRFTRAETAVFCTEVMGLRMSEPDLDTLDARAEGWVAGLQMAALSMQGERDVSQLVAGFSGSNRYVLDYLLEEVLHQQPPAMQRFLLKTAVLDRLCAPLCDAVLTEDGREQSSQAVLERLEAANLFIVPLDAQRRWYRYHHLFSGLLRARLQNEQPLETAELHRRAAAWFASQHLMDEAIAHALAAEDYAQAAGLLEQEGLELVSRHKMVTLARLLEALPDEIVETRPWLCILMAYTRHWLGERRYALGACLDQAEKALETYTAPSEAEERRMRGYIASLRAQDALSAGEDPARIIEQAELALELLPPGDIMGTEAGVSLGGAYWIQGDARAAERAFAAGRDTARRCGKLQMAVPTAVYTAWQQIKQGRLQEALSSLEEARNWSIEECGCTQPICGFPLLRISDLRHEWHEPDEAKQAAQEGLELCLRLGQADVVVDAHATMALRHWAAGDPAAAWESVRSGDEAARDSRPDPFTRTRLDDCRVRLWLEAGQVGNAITWLALEGPDLHGPLSYHHDLHHLQAVRILLADGRPQEALDLAQRVAAAAERAFWVQEQIRALTLAGMAAQDLEQKEQALAFVRTAVCLGAPGGFLHSILDAGPAVPAMLQRLTADRELPRAYLARLLAAAEPNGDGPQTAVTAGLIEPLSERELEILQLIALGLTNNQIAQRLVLSLATVKWHASNLYGKLGARNRNQAVARARDLGLL